MSLLDTIRGVISRRVLVNYRIYPDVLHRALGRQLGQGGILGDQ